MKNRKGLIIIMVAVYAFFLVWYVPANRVFTLLQHGVATPLGSFRCSSLEGTWHDGVGLNGQLGMLPLQEVRWHFKPWALFTGRLSAALSARTEEGVIEATVSRGLKTLSVRNIEGSLALTALRPLMATYGVQLEGSVSASMEDFAIRQGRVTTVQGSLVWHDAAISSTPKAQLGTLVVEFSTLKDEVRATLADTGGPVKVEGLLLLQQDGRYTQTATLLARTPEMAKQIDTLVLFGRKQGDGSVQFSSSGVVPLLAL